MQFEGAEKKAEVYITSNKGSLLTDVLPNYWESLVAQAGAQILSRITNDQCHAYILSESSLFVWHDHFIILTCGETNLAKAVEYFLRSQHKLTVQSVSFQRKNEYFSNSQPTSFEQDVTRLNRSLVGTTTILGSLNQHYVQIYRYVNKAIKQVKGRSCYELLAYHISAKASALFLNKHITSSDIVGFLGLGGLLADFTLDSYQFTPCGYSLNAIKGLSYLTIHITPQAEHSYVSVVSNINILQFTKTLLSQLTPKAFDVLTIDFNQATLQHLALPNGYQISNQQSILLGDTRQVDYMNLLETP